MHLAACEQFGQDMPHPLANLEDADRLLFGGERSLGHYSIPVLVGVGRGVGKAVDVERA